MARGRDRLSSIQLLPKECGHIVRWAADELQAENRTQTDIYREFAAKLDALKAEYRGELEFDIPSFKSFNRYSIRLDETTRYLNEAREMARAIVGQYDAQGADDITLVAVEAIKAVSLQMLTAGKAKLDPKGVMSLANALRAASQAQSVSTARRQKIEAEFKQQVSDVVDAVEKLPDTTPDGRAALRKIREDVYGIFKE